MTHKSAGVLINHQHIEIPNLIEQSIDPFKVNASSQVTITLARFESLIQLFIVQLTTTLLLSYYLPTTKLLLSYYRNTT